MDIFNHVCGSKEIKFLRRSIDKYLNLSVCLSVCLSTDSNTDTNNIGLIFRIFLKFFR